MSYEAKIKKNNFKNQKGFDDYVNQEITEGYKKYFCYDKARKTVARNEAKISEYLSKLGFFIIISGKPDLTKEEVLSYYRNKDKVEKIFDNTKNELNTNRLHSHSKATTDGRLFVKFIATILYQQVTKVMKENDMFKKYSTSTFDNAKNATATVTVQTVTSTEELLFSDLKIYPNPFTGTVRITGAVETRHATSVQIQMQIINAAGAIVYTQTLSGNDETVNLESLPSGVYMFRFEKDGNVRAVRVVVSR